MANLEHSQSGGQDIIEILALFLAGRIKREDFGKDNQTVFDYYFGLMPDDPEFAAQVNSRKNQLMTVGRKIPLYSPDEIKKLAKHKRRIKRNIEPVSQPGLWQDEPISNNQTYGFKNTIDPERKLIEVGKNLDNRFKSHKNTPITEEIKHKKLELRNNIGLPVARGKNPHINDDFYKFLVKRVCTFDTFGIFGEYDRVIDEVRGELDLKIKQVGELVDKLLNKGLNRPQRFREFNQFAQEYRDRWNIPVVHI